MEIHAAIITDPPPNLDPNFLAVKFITAYAASGAIQQATLVFSLLPDPNLFAWNTILKAHSQQNLWFHTLHYFGKLFHYPGAPRPDEYTFTSIIKACAGICSAIDGKKMHSLVLRLGLHTNLFIQNSLIDMYFKLGQSSIACNMFDEMTERDPVTYNTVVSGLSLSGNVSAAREIFDSMGNCKTLISWSAMIAGHAQAGDIISARQLFDEMPCRNIASWNVMISSYAQNSMFLESIELFHQMQHQQGFSRVPPNEVTLVLILSSCAHVGDLTLGRWIDVYAQRNKFHLSLFLGNALADMYAKCGCILDARRVFNKMPERDIVSWTILISGLASNGCSKEAFSKFHEMLQQGIRPNELTFMAILSACSHAGLVNTGLKFFRTMKAEHHIPPKVEHYGCIVDLLSRAGRLDEAEKLITQMNINPNVIVWGALLGGCRIHGDVIRGKRVVKKILELDPNHSGGYTYLANVFAMVGRVEDSAVCRVKMQKRCVEKVPGCSWIEVDGHVHEFLMGDGSHRESKRIYDVIRELGKKIRDVDHHMEVI